MSEMLPVLRVSMLGGFSMMYGEKEISFKRNQTTKAMKLLQILLYHGDKGISRNQLLEFLYGREDLSDVSNNLRVTAHRMKKMLSGAGLPEYDYIRIDGRKYYFASPMAVEVDVLEFTKLYQRAEHLENAEKIAVLRKVCEMYAGDFLPNMSGEEWIVPEALLYKQYYTDALQQVCDDLKEKREYEEVIRFCSRAIELYPFDEWQAIKIECLVALNRYKEAIQVYEETAALFFEELGISPSEKMMEQFSAMSAQMSNRPQAIQSIKGSLREGEKEQGALYCSLPGFRDGYRLVRRMVERSGQSVYLMLCSLTDGKGHPMENPEKLAVLSEGLFHAIQSSLRRGDSFTKYSPTQFLILLVGTDKKNCGMIFDRISMCFSKEHKTWSQYLECNISSIIDIDVENEHTEISFKGRSIQWND